MRLAIGGTRRLENVEDRQFVHEYVKRRLCVGDVTDLHVGDCIGVDYEVLAVAVDLVDRAGLRMRINHHRIFPECGLTAPFPANDLFLRMEYFYVEPNLKSRLRMRTIGCLSNVDEAILFHRLPAGKGSQLFSKICRRFSINSTSLVLPSQHGEHDQGTLFPSETCIVRKYGKIKM